MRQRPRLRTRLMVLVSDTQEDPVPCPLPLSVSQTPGIVLTLLCQERYGTTCLWAYDAQLHIIY